MEKDRSSEPVVDDCVAPLMYHVYENDPVPWEAEAVNVTLFPISVGFCEEVILTDGSAFTVSVRVDDWAVFPTESVIMTYMESVPEELNEVA